jgi:hypothetical protein
MSLKTLENHLEALVKADGGSALGGNQDIELSEKVPLSQAEG